MCHHITIVVSLFLTESSAICLLIKLGLPLDGCVSEERFSALLRHSNGLTMGSGDRQLSTLLGMHMMYFVQLSKAKL